MRLNMKKPCNVQFFVAFDARNLPEIHQLLEMTLLHALLAKDFFMAEEILIFGKARAYLLGATDEAYKFLLALDAQTTPKPEQYHWMSLI